MVNDLKPEECCGCGACESACMTGAISMLEDEEGFRYPVIDEKKCTHCKRCDKVCPVKNKLNSRNELPVAYAGFCRDEKIRSASTSGGIFSVIARHVIEVKKGYVFGVKFDENFNVEYGMTDNLNGIKKFRGSKYPQAETKKIYSSVKKILDGGRSVLFSGLPCQIEALRSFLGKDFPNLYLLDIVCMGVASPGLWNEYRLKNYPDAEEIKFKDKVDGWKNWKIKITTKKKIFYRTRFEDSYMEGFLRKKNIRPSCFDCRFRGLSRSSDFTISDCWGIGEQSALNDDKGLSAILLHSEKAKKIFDEIKNELIFEEYDPILLMEGNWSVFKSADAHPDRKEFFYSMYKNLRDDKEKNL